MDLDDIRDEMKRVRSVADMLVSGHAHLRDRYARYAIALDLAILGLSVWLTAVVFIEPRLNVKLTPFKLDPQVWIGILGVFCFFLSIVQLRVDWKGRSDAHRRSFDMYAEVKRECGYLLATVGPITREKAQRALDRYDLATDVGTPLPEREFLSAKKRHLQKVAISRLLDGHPSASIALIRIRMWVRDNFSSTSGN